MPVPDWAQKILCIIVPNRRTVFPEFFSRVHTRRLLFQSRVVPIKILSARKIKTLFQKYKLELTTGIHACIGHVLRIYSGIFKRYNDGWQPRNRRTEKGIHIFLVSIYFYLSRRANSSGAEFLSTFPSSWREWILSLLVYVLHKTWN